MAIFNWVQLLVENWKQTRPKTIWFSSLVSSPLFGGVVVVAYVFDFSFCVCAVHFTVQCSLLWCSNSDKCIYKLNFTADTQWPTCDALLLRTLCTTSTKNPFITCKAPTEWWMNEWVILAISISNQYHSLSHTLSINIIESMKSASKWDGACAGF